MCKQPHSAVELMQIGAQCFMRGGGEGGGGCTFMALGSHFYIIYLYKKG